MAVINPNNIKQELAVFLRNQDIFTIAQRGVTTTTHSETLVTAGSATITRTNVKNIRSITVDAVTITFGSGYTVSYGTGATGSNCVVTFSSNQSGALVITYDYGTDKIWPDLPRDDLSISSYPRIGISILNAPSDAFGIGGDNFISDINFSVIIYDDNADDIDSYLATVKQKFVDNAKSFYYLKFIKPTLMGPMINDPERNDEIMHRNIDFVSLFNVEN